MLAAGETITLIHHLPGNDSDEYSCTVLNQASWHRSKAENAGIPAGKCTVRIFDKAEITPKPGDYLALGAVETVERPSQLQGGEFFRITAVTDNRRGILSHWRLEGI